MIELGQKPDPDPDPDPCIKSIYLTGRARGFGTRGNE